MTGYDPIMGVFSHTRHCRYLLKAPAMDFIAELLQFPNACIVKRISHEPIRDHQQSELQDREVLTIYQLADRQRVMIDDAAYIDQFGYHVYVSVSIALCGGEDNDERGIVVPEWFQITG